jgi:hypothetical protein
MTLPAFIVAGVVVGAIHGGWWSTAGAVLVAALVYLAVDQDGAARIGTAIAYGVATGAGLAIGVAARRRGARAVPPTR